jgi:hypothetical protein
MEHVPGHRLPDEEGVNVHRAYETIVFGDLLMLPQLSQQEVSGAEEEQALGVGKKPGRAFEVCHRLESQIRPRPFRLRGQAARTLRRGETLGHGGDRRLAEDTGQVADAIEDCLVEVSGQLPAAVKPEHGLPGNFGEVQTVGDEVPQKGQHLVEGLAGPVLTQQFLVAREVLGGGPHRDGGNHIDLNGAGPSLISGGKSPLPDRISSLLPGACFAGATVCLLPLEQASRQSVQGENHAAAEVMATSAARG